MYKRPSELPYHCAEKEKKKELNSGTKRGKSPLPGKKKKKKQKH